MRNTDNHKLNYFGAFILGGITGGILTLLFTPYSGKEFRKRVNTDVNNYIKKAKEKEEELIEKAKTVSDELIIKSIRLAALADKYSGGLFEGPAEIIETEMRSLKAAIAAAVKTYQGGDGHTLLTAPRNDFSDKIFSDFDDVILPKHEGMKRRFKK